MRRIPPSRKSSGMSLLELMAVIVILSLLTTAASMALMGMMRGVELKSAASLVMDALSVAKQVAVTANRAVEVRFYQGADGRYFIKVFKTNEDGSVGAQIDRVIRLPESATFSPNSTWSSLLSNAVSGVPVSDAFGSYRAMRIKPDGTTSLSGVTPATLTIVHKSDESATTLPANFYTIQIDLQTGTVLSFRPS